MRICLCGSTKFKDDYIRINRELSLLGHTVYSVATFGHEPGEELTEDQKILLDLVHLDKILNSDAVYLVGIWTEQVYGTSKDEPIPMKRPYIGDSTRRKIAWAWIHGKTVFHEDLNGNKNYWPVLMKTNLLPPICKPDQTSGAGG